MATKTTKRRKRRTPDEMIADLQAEIARVKERAKARELKQSPTARLVIKLVRDMDKALEVAKGEGNNEVRRVLGDARAPVAAFLTSQGMKLPRPRMPRGPRSGSRKAKA